jgi:hypothetical protein
MERVKSAGFTHYRGQLELGTEGTKHIQCTFGGKSTRFQVVKKLFPTAHIEAAKSPHDSWDYCGKEDTRVEGPVEFGVPPARLNKKGDKAKKNAMLIDKGAEQAVKDGDISIKDYQRFKHNIELYKATTVTHQDLTELDNYWVVGEPGVGKSLTSRKKFPDFYSKPCNKWWDDYNGKATVILDDLDTNHSWLGHNIKIWADHYPFTAETKGGARNVRPTRIVVTSNYHPY